MTFPEAAASQEPPSEPRLTLAQRIAARWRTDVLFFAIAATIVVLDQFTKWLVRSNLSYGESWPDGWELIRIIHVTNSGAAFGILQGQTFFLLVTGMLGLAAILLYYIFPPMEHGIIGIALGMQLGGALGNLIDRVRLGEVTDFIDVGSFPTFNVADASISLSITAVLLFFLLQESSGARNKPSSGVTSSPAHDD